MLIALSPTIQLYSRLIKDLVENIFLMSNIHMYVLDEGFFRRKNLKFSIYFLSTRRK